MKIPASFLLPDENKIQDEETKKIIKELKEVIQMLINILYGDIKEIEERLTAGGH